MDGAGCAARSAPATRECVTTALVGQRHDSRARTGCVRRAVARRVLDRLDAAGADVGARDIRATAFWRAGEARVDGYPRGVRRGARGSEFRARRVSPGA